MTDRAHEIARFICEIIKKEDLPPKRENGDRKAGGVALLGWSLGNAFGFATLANVHTLPSGLQDVLMKYLHTYIAFGMAKRLCSLLS
jgi:hypothetical protein